MTSRTLALTLSAATLALTAGTASAQEYTFRLHHFLPAQAPAQTDMLEPWVEAVEENSGGAVEIEIFPNMTLGGRPQELVSQARDGVVDLVWTVNGYTPGLFPRTEVFELPTVYKNDPGATNLAMYEMFDDYLADDYKGLEVMFLHVHAGQGIHTVETEVREPADLAGTDLRIPTRTGAWVIEALDANPVAMPVPELPQALSKGVVDGALIPWEIIPALGIQEQTDYQIEGADNTRLGTTTFQVSMNKGRWDSLPDEIKQAFDDASGRDWVEEVGQIWRDIDNRGIQIATDAGNEHITLDEEQTQAFMDALQPVVDRWVEQVGGDGIEGQALVDEARSRIEANAGDSAGSSESADASADAGTDSSDDSEESASE